MFRSATDAWPVGCFLVAAALAAMPGVAAGQTAPPKISNDQPPAATGKYWTPERMKKATPKDIGISGAAKQPTRTPPATDAPGGGESK